LKSPRYPLIYRPNLQSEDRFLRRREKRSIFFPFDTDLPRRVKASHAIELGGTPSRPPWFSLSHCQRRKTRPTRGDQDPTGAVPSAVPVLRRADDHRSRTAAQTGARPTAPAPSRFELTTPTTIKAMTHCAGKRDTNILLNSMLDFDSIVGQES